MSLPPRPLPGTLLDDEIAEAMVVASGRIALTSARLQAAYLSGMTPEEMEAFRLERQQAWEAYQALVLDFTTAARTLGVDPSATEDALRRFGVSMDLVYRAFVRAVEETRR